MKQVRCRKFAQNSLFLTSKMDFSATPCTRNSTLGYEYVTTIEITATEDKYTDEDFERSRKMFESLWSRLLQMERWTELAIRPSPSDCDPDDLFFLEREMDNVPELQKRCEFIRNQVNDHLPPIEEALDSLLISKPSNIPEVGLGLFYCPSSPKPIPAGTILCYYAGHIHTYQSSRLLEDKSYFMMVRGNSNGICRDAFVDAGPLNDIKARYINDPMNDTLLNCKFVPLELRAAVTSTRIIQPGEELFASYGHIYWNSQKEKPRRLQMI